MRKLTLKEFIDKSNKIHNNKYDYSLVEYTNNSTKVQIICPKHGIFEQRPNQHKDNEQGCPKCSGFGKTKIELIKDFNKIHNNKYKYDFSNFKDKHSKIAIICPKHGRFKQVANSHQSGIGCPKCGGSKRLTTEEFINRSNIHDSKYDYSLTKYKSAHKKVKIICPEHGKFEQTPNSHLRGNGCVKCKTNISKGEQTIMDWLKEHNIKYDPQHTFPDCKYKRKLPFDFYLPDYNTLIEYNGSQHFIMSEGWGGEEKLKLVQLRDKIKFDYCKDNNIKLLRIKYNENIEDKLNHHF